MRFVDLLDYHEGDQHYNRFGKTVGKQRYDYCRNHAEDRAEIRNDVGNPGKAAQQYGKIHPQYGQNN